ncbi:restriction endonuclease subunit S [uncultured Desulfuromonas sp.]|uniref:restriction endonuclease subunit S n=1 Tax=uncultured Desulfuromonas sp. TaxID=181013 RepID=UPI002AABCDBA|nr:restriction endonuclease subunit S [uncultured Desulfuromonas sp.]
MVGWVETTLGAICQIKPPKKEAKQKLSDSEMVSFVPMNNLGICTKAIELDEDKTLGEVSRSYTYFADDDVLLAKITPCFENGKLGIARGLTNGIGFGSSEFIVFRSKGTIDPEFLFYFLAQDSFRVSGARIMTGAVGHKRVTKEFIEDHPIILPPSPNKSALSPFSMKPLRGSMRQSPIPRRTSPMPVSCLKAI